VETISEAEWSAWKTSLAELLLSNRVCVNGHRYTRPAPSIYEHQWLWDSCFHAIGCRWIDPDMARDELLSLVVHQFESGPDAGMIPHMAYWGGGGKELWPYADRSTITQPPLIGVAAWKVYAVARDRALLESLYPHLAAFHAWFDRRRDPDGDDLVCLIHPWEAGWDSSPRWDRGMKLPDQFPSAVGTAARKELAAVLPAYEHDPVALAQAGYFLAEPLDFNAVRAADLDALAEIAGQLAKPADAAHWQGRAQAVRRAVQTRLMQPAPHDLEGMDERPIRVDCASYFIALFGGCATPAQAGQFVNRLQQPDFWTVYPVPTTPTGSPAHSPQGYWRGNVWMSVNYLIYMGLRRYGYFDLASLLVAKTIDLARLSGYREYYHPVTGEGFGAKNQSWLALLLDMIAEERNMTHG
jgi:glycogen debranching enzyme